MLILLFSGLTVVFSVCGKRAENGAAVVMSFEGIQKVHKEALRSSMRCTTVLLEQFSKNMVILKESSSILPKELFTSGQDVLKGI